MAGVVIELMTTLTSTLVWQDPSHYYCGEQTFFKTPVSISRNPKFVTDVTADPNQNLTLLLEAASFVIDVTGCLTPLGIVRPAVGVEITYQKLPILYSGAIQNIILLQMIKIEHCEVEDIHPGAFMILPSIETIFLRFNIIERIKEGVFNHLRVEKLYLSNNSISYIENKAFDYMPNLNTIELDNNNLKSWNTDWFTYSPNLQHLSLASNKLAKLPAHAFSKLKNDYFTSIRLSNNEISFIHPTAFEDLSLLYALWLDNNNINVLDDEIFRNFKRLYILTLRNNNIKCLSEDLLFNLQSEDLVLHVEDNERIDCECLKRIQTWAKMRKYFLTEQYAKKECDKIRTKNRIVC